jgi:hypothetical protein
MDVQPVLRVVAPVFVCEPAPCAFQLNQEVGELRVLRASLALVERAAEAGGALARQALLALALELRGSVAVELQETQCRRVVGGGGGGSSLPRASCVSGGEHLRAGRYKRKMCCAPPPPSPKWRRLCRAAVACWVPRCHFPPHAAVI